VDVISLNTFHKPPYRSETQSLNRSNVANNKRIPLQEELGSRAEA